MSLISDALKTAQRERSGHMAAGAPGEPLLDGFFPYVSTSSSSRRPSRTRVAVISGGALLVIAIGAWFSVPAIKRVLGARQKPAPSIVLPPRQAAQAPTSAPAQSPAPDTQAVAVAVPDSAPPTVAEPAPQPGSSTRRVREKRGNEAHAVVSAPEPARPLLDSAAARPQIALAPTTDRPNTVARPNLEADAIAAFNAGDYATARRRFEVAVRTLPTASAWTNFGVTLEKLGDPQSAVRAYRSAMALDPNYFNAWLYLARVYNLLGDVGQAVPLFNRALEIEPNNSDVNADLAELEYKAGAFTEARRYADVAAKSNPANPRAQYYLALSADTLKDRVGARQAFEDYLRAMVGQEKDNLPSIGYARIRLQELKSKP